MFSKILSSTIAATVIVAAAPAFAADPFDGPGWEPAMVDDTTVAPSPDATIACADGAAEQKEAGMVDDTTAAPSPNAAIACADTAAGQNEAPGVHDRFDRSQDFGG
jgi:hypothetical protein